MSTDCESSTLPTVARHSQVDLCPSQQRGDLDIAGAAPATPDLSSLFCTSQTGNRNNRTGSGSTRREKTSRRSSWIELDRSATTLSTTVPADDDTDDVIRCGRVTRDVMSASSSLGSCKCSSGLLLDGADAAGMFQRSTSLDADVCRLALTGGVAASPSQPLVSRPYAASRIDAARDSIDPR